MTIIGKVQLSVKIIEVFTNIRVNVAEKLILSTIKVEVTLFIGLPLFFKKNML
jgi:hypothetical protein